MSGQEKRQVGTQLLTQEFDATIKQRDLSNFDVAVQLGVTEKTVIRWRNEKHVPYANNRRLIAKWIAEDPDADLEAAA